MPREARPARTVLLTGASGHRGRAALRAFGEIGDVTVRAFSLPTRQDRRVLAEFAQMENVEVHWGDLTSAADVRDAVAGVDLVVLHLGAVVSPLADARPDLAERVNVLSMRHIVDAVAALPDPAAVGVVGVGSVAQTGDRPPGVHWGRVGDPLRVSIGDVYALTKVSAERILVDSGLPRWAWVRQGAILHPGMLAIRDPIITHVTLDGVMEWVSDADSARLLVGLAGHDVPPEFWGGIYNVGGGEAWRLTNWQLQELVFGAMGLADPRRWFERDWFATRNFHGHWFTDSDRLHDLVPLRQDAPERAMARSLAVPGVRERSGGRRAPGGEEPTPGAGDPRRGVAPAGCWPIHDTVSNSGRSSRFIRANRGCGDP